MATKHYIQHYMFRNSNGAHLTQVVTYLESAAYTLQHIQVNTYAHLYIMYVTGILNYRNYIPEHLVWNSQENNI